MHSTNIQTGAEEGVREAAWPAVISLSLGVFGLVTAEFLPVSLLTPISQDLGASVGAAGQSMTMTAMVAAIAGPGVVIGTRRIDRRKVLLVLTALLVISSFMTATANGLAMLLGSRVILGVALGGFWAMSIALAMRLVPARLMPRAMAIIMTGVSVATVCAAPVGAWVGATLGWRWAFVIAAVVGVIALVIQTLSVPRLPPSGHAGIGTMLAVLRRPAIRLGLVTILFVVSGHFAGFTYIRPFLETVPRFEVEAISGILLAFGIGGFFGNIFGGIVAERSTSLAMTLASGGIAIATLVLASAGADPSTAAITTGLWGFVFGAFPVSAQSFITRGAADEAESAGAMMLTTFQIAISSGAVLGGLLVETEGPAGVFTMAGIAALLGTSVMLVGSRLQAQPSPEGAR